MEYFVSWVFDNFRNLISELTRYTVNTISHIVGLYIGDGLDSYTINLVLFSETPILTIGLGELLNIFFSIFYTVIFIVIVWKIVKKVVVKITRWNRW